MIIDSPSISIIPSLKALWKEAFSDNDEFINAFFSLGFSEQRALCVLENKELAGALYWFDMEYKDEKIAYIYGVATAKKFRGKGIGTAMMKKAKDHLSDKGYSAITLVPAQESVFGFYKKLGYKVFTHIDNKDFAASVNKTKARKVSVFNYFEERKKYTQNRYPSLSSESFDFLDYLLEFYIGDDFISAIRKDSKTFSAVEFIGNLEKCSDFINTLGYKKGTARLMGTATPFAMYLPLNSDYEIPFDYLGFALD